MDLVDEQHIARLEVGQQRRQIAGALQHRAGGALDRHAHFLGDDVGQGGLAEARRAEDQRVVQRFRPTSGRLDEQLHLFAHAGLADVLGQLQRADGAILLLLAFARRSRDQAVGFNHLGSSTGSGHALEGTADQFFAGQIVLVHQTDGATGLRWLEAEGHQGAHRIALCA
ncbi:hypothetical protein D3C80_1012390 [compost metagenome]